MNFTSNSEIQTFKDCRRRWWLSHVRKLKRKFVEISRPRDVGTQVHKTLDVYYGNDMDVDYAMGYFYHLVESQEAMFAEDEKQLKEAAWVSETSRIMLEGYFEWVRDEGVDAHLTIVAPEATVQAPLGDTGYVLLGKLDVRVWNDETNARQFLETKTVANFSDLEKWSHMNEQLYEYHLLELLMGLEDDTRTDGAILNMIRRVKRTRNAKPPFFKRKDVWHNEDELRNFYYRVFGAVHDMIYVRKRLERGASHHVVAYPRPTRDCSWKCDFFQVCPMFDDPHSDAEGFLAAGFEEHDPHARYGKVVTTEEEG